MSFFFLIWDIFCVNVPFRTCFAYSSANTDLHAYSDDFFSSSSVSLSFVICKSYVNK